jgi:hypothetical protein
VRRLPDGSPSGVFLGRTGLFEDVLTRLSVGGNTPAGSSVECSELNFMEKSANANLSVGDSGSRVESKSLKGM